MTRLIRNSLSTLFKNIATPTSTLHEFFSVPMKAFIRSKTLSTIYIVDKKLVFSNSFRVEFHTETFLLCFTVNKGIIAQLKFELIDA